MSMHTKEQLGRYWEKTGSNTETWSMQNAAAAGHAVREEDVGDEGPRGVVGQVVEVLNAMLMILKFAFYLTILPLFLNR